MANRKNVKTKAKTHGDMTYKEIMFWGGGIVAVIALFYFM